MPFMSMEPTNQSFQEMMSNGVKYQIPRFQRDYAWEQEQWEDLWADIETLPQEHYHYMGYVVLQRKSQYDFEVIDGQQRLITLSLIILAAMKKIENLIAQNIEAENNRERLEEIRRRFIGTKNPVSLSVDNKLSLNRNNNSNFRKICSKLETVNMRGLSKTNKLLNVAFGFFLNKKNMGVTGEDIALFIERVTSGTVFTKIVVKDDINAYKVFETLNARGVQLSTPDLLKNYLFSVVTQNNSVPDTELDDLDAKWGEVVTQLGEADFTDFIRYHHNFQAKLTTKKNLFASIRRLVVTPTLAYEYLNSLDEYAPLFASLGNPDDEWWNNQKDEAYRRSKSSLQGLKLFNIKQPFAILMRAFFAFNPDEYEKLSKYILILSIRYNVICHYSPNEQEQTYNEIAMKIHSGEFSRASHVKNSDLFKKLYPGDDEFKNAFEFLKMPSRPTPKKIRYILSKIESQLGNNVSEQEVTLEHICPYNPDKDWIQSFGDGYDEVQDRPGNMILLSHKDNHSLGSLPFEKKREKFGSSRFKLAEKVSTYSEWTKSSVDNFQSWLAEQAVKTWKIE